MLSRGKLDYISKIEGQKKLLKSCKIVPDPLFIENNGTYIQKKCDDAQTDNEYLKAFYFYGRFNKQYFSRTVPFNRSDILKLCFWDFLSMNRRKKYDPETSKSDFTSKFDRLARQACCGEINERNSLDRFLLLCLSYENPGQFLKEAIMYYVYSESEKSKEELEKSKEFREMLK